MLGTTMIERKRRSILDGLSAYYEAIVRTCACSLPFPSLPPVRTPRRNLLVTIIPGVQHDHHGKVSQRARLPAVLSPQYRQEILEQDQETAAIWRRAAPHAHTAPSRARAQ